MLHDVIFNDDVSAYDNWHIALTKVEKQLPAPKTSSINIQGSDGITDLSEVLTNDIKFNNRSLKLTFSMMDDRDYDVLISEISNYIHGKNLKLILTNDKQYYYVGRAIINQWECIKRKGTIVIMVDCEPYKYRVNETVIFTSVSGTKFLTLENSRKQVCPILTVTGSITITLHDVEYELSVGEQQLLNFILFEGENIVKVSGTGTLKITYRMGCL